MNWQGEIVDFLGRSIDVFLRYYVSGILEKVELVTYIERGEVEVKLTVGGREQKIDYDAFKCADDEDERDKQRECYFENESLWMEYFIALENNFTAIEKSMGEVSEVLAERYHVDVVSKVKTE